MDPASAGRDRLPAARRVCWSSTYADVQVSLEVLERTAERSGEPLHLRCRSLQILHADVQPEEPVADLAELGHLNTLRGEVAVARELGQQALTLAEMLGDPKWISYAQ